jgi:hypothetical protein
MTQGKKSFVLILSLLLFGCSAATSSTQSGTGLQPRKTINCATIDLESLTSEELQYCHGGSK